jgi:FdhD protein
MRQLERRQVLRVNLSAGAPKETDNFVGAEPEPESSDWLAVEEPLEIRLGGQRFTVTMRTPGHDEELIAGFLMSEGLVTCGSEIGEIRRPPGRNGAPESNVADVVLNVPAERLRNRIRSNVVISSSCGLCGRLSIESVLRHVEPIQSRVAIAASLLLELPSRMRRAQEIFAATGGLHAAALFDISGELRTIREDIGRHNAVDKVVGHELRSGRLDTRETVLMVSGRLSFEIVQKSAVAGIPILAGVSAPSSLAVEMAEEAGVTLAGFVRDMSFNLYTHPERVRNFGTRNA